MFGGCTAKHEHPFVQRSRSFLAKIGIISINRRVRLFLRRIRKNKRTRLIFVKIPHTPIY